MKVLRFISICCGFLFFQGQSQELIRGLVVQENGEVMPFVYLINKSNGNGTMSDNEGRFSIRTSLSDTLVCTFVGFLKRQVPVRSLRKDADGIVRIEMIALPVTLAPITVTTFRIKPYEREYMQSIIEQSLIRKLDYAYSPISALYMQYSKEGRQIRKLAKIFEDVLVEEQAQKKLNREILVRLTGDDNIDYEGFRKYCYYLSNYYVAAHEGVELYSRVMDCYKTWKAEGRDQPLKRRDNPQ